MCLQIFGSLGLQPRTLAAIYFKQRQYELSVQEVRTAKKLKPSLPPGVEIAPTYDRSSLIKLSLIHI